MIVCLLLQVVWAINTILLRRVINLSNADPIITSFANMGFPNCRGTTDSTQIPIRASGQWSSVYINFMGYFSIVLQSLVNHRKQFSNIFVGCSEKAHNTRMFRNSSTCQKLEDCTSFTDRTIRVRDVDVPLHHGGHGLPSLALVHEVLYQPP